MAPVRIAITGGGLAGAFLIHACQGRSNLDVHIFESAPVFKEAGAAIGVIQSAHQALELIGPSAVRCLENAGAVSLQGVRWMMARGPEAGSEIDRVDATSPDQPVTNIVHRADFLRELLADIPPSHMHASKQLVNIEDPAGGPVRLFFSDGTTHDCDILIGADGIRSHVRKYVLGEHDPAATPVSAGWWFVQALKSYDDGLTALGKDVVKLDYPVEFDYAGQGCWWMHNVLSKGKLVQCVICVKCDADEASNERWKKTVDVEDIKKLFGSWPEPIKTAVHDLICDQPTATAMYLWDHLPARTYHKNSVGLIGDAAHATTPWMSSGVGMAIEDAMILSNVLGRANTQEEAQLALKVYDEVRRPRTQRVVETSRGTGQIMTGDEADFDLNSLSEMKLNLPKRWDFIRFFDLAEHRDEAVRLIDLELSKAREAV